MRIEKYAEPGSTLKRTTGSDPQKMNADQHSTALITTIKLKTVGPVRKNAQSEIKKRWAPSP